ncbi:hypothetical protein [uncultured Corynebacterium sp.]|uniref:hypothetical protein n=1 Tax=uncultured Corynebacterium sp. TaxID=159447 RepID=UPI0025EDA857|nr:hypothetical protein [uncultured Corynebacterium sp.]
MSSPGNPNDRPYYDDSSHPTGSPHSGGPAYPVSPQYAAAAPGGGRGTPSTALIAVLGTIVVVLVLMIGVLVGVMMNRDSGANGAGGDDPVAPVAQPTTASPGEDGPGTVTVTEEARPEPDATTVRDATDAQSTTPEDLGTGRSDIDSRGWEDTPGARCHAGDRAFAVIQAESGARAAACQTPGGRQYYRGHDPDVGSLEAEIMGTSERDIVAQNGPVKYQMSFGGLLISDENGVIENSLANVWGRIDLN